MLRIALGCAALLSVALSLCGQQLSSQANDSFVSRTDFVVVPVIVTDSSGKHVSGLTKADFRLWENGREQRIAQFEEVTAKGASLRTTPPVDGVYTNRVASGEPASALAIVLLDQLNGGHVSQYWGVRATLSFLDKWRQQNGFPHPIMLAALNRSGLRIIHGPTMDPAVLVDAIGLMKAKHRPRTENKPDSNASSAEVRQDDTAGPIQIVPDRTESEAKYINQLKNANQRNAALEVQVLEELSRAEAVVRRYEYEVDERTTFWALQGLANAVGGIPGRKVLIWVAGNFPFALRVQSTSPQWARPLDPSQEESVDVDELRSETLLTLDKALMSVYPVQAQGLVTPDFLGADWGGRLTDEAYRASQWIGRDTITSARFVADQTGGVPCLNTNDIAACLQHSIEDSAQHYLLAYYPDPKPKNEGWRSLKVKVQREHVNVRPRHQYYFGGQPGRTSAAKEDVAIALKTKLLYTSLPVAVRVVPPTPDKVDQRTAQFVLAVDGRALTIDEKHGNHISLTVGIQAGQGTPTFQNIDTQLKSEAIEQIRTTRLTHNGTIDLSPGKYEMRVVVRDNLSGQMGSVLVPLEVD